MKKASKYLIVAVMTVVLALSLAACIFEPFESEFKTDAQRPVIDTQPQDAAVDIGTTHALSVTASVTDGGALSYQWYSKSSASATGGTIIDGETSASYSVPTTDTGRYYYYVAITNTNKKVDGQTTTSTNSNVATLTVNAQKPVIDEQPQNATVNAEAKYTLSVTASVTDGGALSYQWYRNSSASISEGTRITSATNASYSASESTAGTYYYYVVITNTKNGVQASITSDVVTLTVNANAQRPVIDIQPQNTTVNAGSTHTLSIAASVTDGGALSYQWYSNSSASTTGGTIIDGETSASYSVQTDVAGRYYYYVIITNTNNSVLGNKTASVTSNVITLTVNPQRPAITAQPQNATVNADTAHTLSVTASVTDGGTLSYQWYGNSSASTSDGTEITGAKSASYSAPTDVVGTYYYYVVITNTKSGMKSTVTSSVVTLKVNANASTPNITTQPQDMAVNSGSTHTLSIAASVTDGGALSYQWYVCSGASATGGTEITGATGTSYSASAYAAGVYYYYVVVTNVNYGVLGAKTVSVVSRMVTLTVDNLQFTQIYGGNSSYSYSVSKGSATSTHVVIPSVYKGWPVTVIANSGFEDYTAMTSITIPDSVTIINSYAFENCSNLTSITLPDTVTIIGYSAFENCSSLESVVFGDDSKLTIIYGYAFRNCTGLESITIPASVTSIGYYAFYNCSSLESVVFRDDSKLTNIGEYAFRNCIGLESITIPASVTSIGKYAFYDCSSLESVAFGADSKLTNIGEYAFYNCSSLESVAFGADSKLTNIGEYAFYNCSSLESITVPASVTSIGGGAFSGCTGLESVVFRDDSKLTNIGNRAFSGCTGLESITIPDSIISIGQNVFINSGIWDNAPANSVVYADKWVVGYKGTISSSITLESNTVGICASAFSGFTYLASITIPDTVTSIGSGAFNGCFFLTNITIPASVTSIGENAFENCSRLENINVEAVNCNYSSIDGVLFDEEQATLICYPEGKANSSYSIPSSVTSIEIAAFSYCDNLTSVTIPDSVTSIGIAAFRDCSNLTSVTIPASVTSIGEDAFENCTGLESVVFGEDSKLERIGGFAFSWCGSLESITIPDSVTSIGIYAFSGCGSLESVIFEANSKIGYIGDSVFRNCGSLESITIPASVTSIGSSAFENCVSLERVVFEANSKLERIYSSAFAKCSSLESVVFGEDSKLPSIGIAAFYGCSSLTSITMPDSVTSIGSSAFSGCSSLESVIFGANSNLESIGSSAFQNCYNLLEIVIPESVTTIDANAFVSCNALIIYAEAEAKPQGWDNGWNPDGLTVEWSYGSGLEFVLSSDGTYYIVAGIKNGSTKANIIILAMYKGKPVKVIGEGAFEDCYSLTSITIPASVTSISSAAFYAGSLTSINVEVANLNYSSIDGVLFDKEQTTLICYPAGKTGSSYSIPSSVTSIGSYAFYGCSSLTSITIPASVTSIGYSSFSRCGNLLEIVIPESVTTINADAFNYCNALIIIYAEAEAKPQGWDNGWNPGGLTVEWSYGGGLEFVLSSDGTYYIVAGIKNGSTKANIIIPATHKGKPVKVIGEGAFRGNTYIITANISVSVMFIEEAAFEGCINLETVTFAIGSGLIMIDKFAFCDCLSLESINIPSTITNLGDHAFENVPPDTVIDLPPAVPEKNIITQIKAVDFGSVAYGTTFASLNLPTLVIAQNRFGVGVTAVVTWNSSTYNSTDVGRQTINGTIVVPSGYTATTGLIARLYITVNPQAQSTVIISIDTVDLGKLPVGTTFQKLGLPTNVGVTLQGGGRINLPVVWSQIGYSTAAGTYVINGTVNTSGYTLSGTTAATTATVELSENIEEMLDIVFVVDWTGSMSENVNPVKNNLINFATYLAGTANVRFGLVTYTNKGYTVVHDNGEGGYWFADVTEFIAKINGLGTTTGADEVYFEGLEYARRSFDARRNAKVAYILITDEVSGNPANEFGITSQVQMVGLLKSEGWDFSLSVVTLKSLYSYYSYLATETGGVMIDLDDPNFQNALRALADNILGKQNP